MQDANLRMTGDRQVVSFRLVEFALLTQERSAANVGSWPDGSWASRRHNDRYSGVEVPIQPLNSKLSEKKREIPQL